MDNYKIKVKDEAESKEAQELFFKLGYGFFSGKNKAAEEFEFSGEFYFFAYGSDCDLTVSKDHNLFLAKNDFQELTLPQLRDLVVLKRNDVKDATHVDPGGTKHIELDGRWYWFHEESTPDIQFGWVESASYREYDDKVLKPIKQPQDPALISGAEAELVEQAKRFITSDHLNRFEAAKAHLEGKAVQFMLSNGAFFDITDDSTVGIFGPEGGYSFRLKPQTIKLELEIPAPYKAKIGGRDDTAFVLNVGRHQYCYNNEEDYTKARNALEAVFDSALRGTNS